MGYLGGKPAMVHHTKMFAELFERILECMQSHKAQSGITLIRIQTLRECFLSQFVASFNIRRMLAM